MNDPDKRLKTLARGKMSEDELEKLLFDIEEGGSVMTYIDAKNNGDTVAVEALEANGLVVPLSEEIVRVGELTEWGSGAPGHLALILLHVGKTAVVQGWVGDKDNGERCRSLHHFRIASAHEFELWFGSCEYLLSRHDDLDLVCVLEADLEDEEITRVMRDLLPQTEFYFAEEERDVSTWNKEGLLSEEGLISIDERVLHIRLKSAIFQS